MSMRVSKRPNRRQMLAHALTAIGACSASVASTARSDETSKTNTGSKTPDPQALIAILSRYLWSAQSADGRWSSQTYALLRSGQALTPFVLSALLEANGSHRDAERATAAKAWMITQFRGGGLGLSDPDMPEYPVFATAFALSCLTRFDSRDDDGLTADARKFLLDQQLVERRGFRPSDLAYGGWGFGGHHAPGQSGHMDLSHTRWALSALATGPSEVDSSSYQAKAQRFLRLLQKRPDEDRDVPLGDGAIQHQPTHDGGFYFSPIIQAANKGRTELTGDRRYFRSYATATCDGVISLLATGLPVKDDRVRTARHWLEAHPDWENPFGIPKDFPEPWGDAVYFYHQAVRAEAYRRLGVSGDWAERLIERLTMQLRSDGSIANNRSALMKENDPILCSTLALIAATQAAAVPWNSR